MNLVYSMNNTAISIIPEEKRQALGKFLQLLAQVQEVKAIVLGGSYARGTAKAESDIDIAIYYSEANPLNISAIQKIVREMNPSSTATEVYEWGAWVNGGAWIETASGKIDLLYRSLEHVDHVIEESFNGVNSCDYLQQPPYGFYSVTYLGETATCIPIYDPENLIQEMKEKVKKYPEALKKGIIQQNLWSVEFTLLHAKKCAKGNDLYTTTGCITRVLSCLTQVLFALNEIYFISDREALNSIDRFRKSPNEYRQNIEAIISHLNTSDGNLVKSLHDLEKVFFDVKKLVGMLYEPKYRLE